MEMKFSVVETAERMTSFFKKIRELTHILVIKMMIQVSELYVCESAIKILQLPLKWLMIRIYW